MFKHVTVLLQESVDGLNIKEDGVYVDCTLGGAGHSALILSKLGPNGRLYCFDQDQTALDYAQSLFQNDARVTFIQSNFRYIKEQLHQCGVFAIDGVLFDLGVSSPQLDTPERGFSYHHDAKLDMRMNQKDSFSAYDFVNEASYEQMVKTFFTYGEEKFSKSIARKIEQYRTNRPIETTLELVDIIKSGIPAAARREGGHPAKRIFQAIRIEVNDELQAFKEALESSLSLLNSGGRICVITFHSLEDRICKQFFQANSTPPKVPRGLPLLPEQAETKLRLITRKPIVPGVNELEKNKRSRSSRLRIAEKN